MPISAGLVVALADRYRIEDTEPSEVAPHIAKRFARRGVVPQYSAISLEPSE